jgi:hypothetical protein
VERKRDEAIEIERKEGGKIRDQEGERKGKRGRERK